GFPLVVAKLGEEIFIRFKFQPLANGKICCPFSAQENVITVKHHLGGKFNGVSYITYTSNRTCGQCAAIHNCSIHFLNTAFCKNRSFTCVKQNIVFKGNDCCLYGIYG